MGSGQINQKDGLMLRKIFAYEMSTMCKGENSVLGRVSTYLRQKGRSESPFEYLKFFGLRNHCIMPDGNPVTEICYIHSKLMIVDDMRVILGSANLDDRSQMGERDSELAVVIEDEMMEDGTFMGKPAKLAKFAYSFRKKIWETLF